MAIYSGPEIVNSGLVFYYDIDNTEKSWKGKPTTNLVNPDVSTWTTKTAIISTLNIKSPVGDVVYSLTDNTTTNYLLVGQTVAVPNDSSPYTVSVYILKTYGATSARLGFNYSLTGGTAVNTTHRFNSDTGVATAGSVIDLDEWWRWSITITNNSTGNTSLNCSFYPATGTHNASDNVNGVGTAIISGMQLEQNSFATPFVNGTRSNTQAILDLAGSNTITANSLTYNSNGSFSYNSSGANYITFPLSVLSGLTSWTIDFWMNRSVSNSSSIDTFLTCGSGNNFLWYFRNPDNTVTLENTAISSLAYTVVNGEPFNFVATGSGGLVTVYKNGLLVGTMSNTTTITTGSTIGAVIGQEMDSSSGGFDAAQAFKGDIYSTKIYNRVLSGAEVLTNFEASRDRYGV